MIVDTLVGIGVVSLLKMTTSKTRHRGHSLSTTAEPLTETQKAVKVHRIHPLFVLWAFYCKWVNGFVISFY